MATKTASQFPIPLTMTAVNWKPYIQAYVDKVGKSPTAAIDAEGLDIKEAATFLSALQPGLPANQAISRVSKYHQLLTFAFLIYEEQSTLLEVNVDTDLVVVPLHTAGTWVLAILQGNLFQWYGACKCLSTQATATRQLLNDCERLLSQSGQLRSLWKSCDWIQLADGTRYCQ